ncbi:hypothetical protein L2E82_35459 [Cichorium intybus]|uniref:Uncharacterized protein n=1 Tax=Cichorium intybus TaxID=13427 RepID=A0ACB9BNW4_CICIN|nr:hypothetical protein L2E82_35459 [Cichorium intybus]
MCLLWVCEVSKEGQYGGILVAATHQAENLRRGFIRRDKNIHDFRFLKLWTEYLIGLISSECIDLRTMFHGWVFVFLKLEVYEFKALDEIYINLHNEFCNGLESPKHETTI